MKTYVFFTAGIFTIGGMQTYVSNIFSIYLLTPNIRSGIVLLEQTFGNDECLYMHPCGAEKRGE